VGVCVGGNHWVGVGSSVSVGPSASSVDVTEGISINVAVGVGVRCPASGFKATSTEMPMQ